MTQWDAECVVVGGGIGGTVLALALGRAGRQVLILEREIAPPNAPRPEILAGATLDAFAKLGVEQRILREAAVPIAGLELFEAGGRHRIFGVTQQDIREANVRPHSTDPAMTRRILLEEAVHTGRVRVERGVEVIGLLREQGCVVGVEACRKDEPLVCRAALTIGDDGTHSRIRTALDISAPLADFPFDFLGAVVSRLPGQPEQTGQVWLDIHGLRKGIFAGIFLPIPNGKTALVFIMTPQAATEMRQSSAETFYAAAARFSPLCADANLLPRFPEGYGYFRRPFGHAARYVSDGAALMGDAAHPVTPAGGQGANMSIADAMVLAEVVLECLQRGDCSAQQLSRYESVRRPANERSLRFSAVPRQVFKWLQFIPALSGLLTFYLRYVDANQKLKIKFLGSVGRAFKSEE